MKKDYISIKPSRAQDGDIIKRGGVYYRLKDFPSNNGNVKVYDFRGRMIWVNLDVDKNITAAYTKKRDWRTI